MKFFARIKLLRKILIVLAHSILWGLFIFYPLFMFNITVQDSSFLVRLAIHGTILAAIFYLNMYVLIPRFYAKKKYLAYFGFVLLIFTVIFTEEVIASSLFFHRNNFEPFKIENRMSPKEKPQDIFAFKKDSLFRNPPPKPGSQMRKNPFERREFRQGPLDFIFNPRTIGKVFSSGIIVLALSGFFRMAKEWAFVDQQRKELEKSKLNAELSLLKSQVNPHFLFNSLNSIYSLAHKRSDFTEKAIVKLSHLMRYMIYDVTEEFVSLGKEIDYLQNYVELQKLRMSDKMSVKFEVDEYLKDSKIQIAPMLLIVLVENAFKHGVSYAKPSEIKIELNATEQEINFLVSNEIAPQSEDSDHKGKGLENLTKRLQLIYPKKHQLTVDKENNVYSAKLKIQV